MPSIIEIRSYQLHAGSGAQFDRIMQTQSKPLMASAGVKVLLAQASLHAPDTYLLVRAYDSLEQREASQAAFYASEAWLQGPCEAIMACIDSYATSVLAVDTTAAVDFFTAAAAVAAPSAA